MDHRKRSHYFNWPGFDLRTDPKTGKVEYGMLPKAFFEEVHADMLKQLQLKRMQSSNRGE
jgi:hypothetical protein